MTSQKHKPSEGRKRTPLYRFSQAIVSPIIRLYFRHSIYGTENLPEKTGAVIATNHASVLDPIFIGVDLPRPLFIMAKKSLHDLPLFGAYIRAMHSFPVRRGKGSGGALQKAIEIVKEGNLILVFIEGSRTRDGELKTPKPGVGKIANESGCPVIPGYVDNSFRALGPNKWVPRPVKTWTRFGKPLQFTDCVDEAESKRRQYRQCADAVMDRITQMKEQGRP